MKRILLSLAAVSFAVLVVASPAGIADGGSLWPFSSTSAAPPAAKPAAAPAAKSPSVLTKLSNGTKSLLTKTKNALTPKAAPKRVSIEPPNPYMPKTQTPKKAWFDGLLAKKPPPKPKTPSEWIGLPRPN